MSQYRLPVEIEDEILDYMDLDQLRYIYQHSGDEFLRQRVKEIGENLILSKDEDYWGEKGDLQALEFLYDKGVIPNLDDYIDTLVIYGTQDNHLNLLTRAYELNPDITSDYIERNKQWFYSIHDTKILDWLRSINFDLLSPDILDDVSKNSSYDAFLWFWNLAENNIPDKTDHILKRDSIRKALEVGNLDIIKFLYNEIVDKHNINSYFFEYLTVPRLIKATNNMELFNWLLDKTIEHGKDVFPFIIAAARTGNVEVLRYLHDLGYNFDHPEIITRAAESGNLETVEYLYSIGADIFNPWVAHSASFSYDDDLKAWLTEQGVEIPDRMKPGQYRKYLARYLKSLSD